MTKKERVRAALGGEEVDRPPVSMWGHDPPREWQPEHLVASTVEAYRAGGWDFIKLNPRASYFGEAWGNHYEASRDNQRPELVDAVVKDVADLDAVAPVDAFAGVFGEHLQAVAMLVEEVGDEADIIHTVFSPLGVLGNLCGEQRRFQQLAWEDPASAHAALAALTETLDEYAEAALERGAAGIFYAPLQWATHDQAREAFYREFGRPYDLQILSGLRDAEFNVLHVCGDRNMLEMLLDYPVAAFNWADRGEGNPNLQEIRGRVPAAVIGGIDHQRLPTMSEEELAGQVGDALSGGFERLMIGPGCSIPPETSPERRAAVGRLVRELSAAG